VLVEAPAGTSKIAVGAWNAEEVAVSMLGLRKSGE